MQNLRALGDVYILLVGAIFIIFPVILLVAGALLLGPVGICLLPLIAIGAIIIYYTLQKAGGPARVFDPSDPYAQKYAEGGMLVQCPKCKASVRVTEKYRPAVVQCHSCKKDLVVKGQVIETPRPPSYQTQDRAYDPYASDPYLYSNYQSAQGYQENYQPYSYQSYPVYDPYTQSQYPDYTQYPTGPSYTQQPYPSQTSSPYYQQRSNYYYQPAIPRDPAIRTDTSIVEKFEIPNVSWLFWVFIAAAILGGLALYLVFLMPFVGLAIFFPCYVIAFSFPSLIWISYAYHRDLYEPEPKKAILTALTWGMLSVLPALLLEMAFGFLGVFAGIALVAPFAEELVKPLGLPWLRSEIEGEMDGLIYGVTMGMGFAMVENMLYMIMGAGYGADWSLLVIVRGLGSTIGHAVGAGMIGYAYGGYVRGRWGPGAMIVAYAAGVALHAIWNASVTLLAGSLIIILILILQPMLEFAILSAFLDRAEEHEREVYVGKVIPSSDARNRPKRPGWHPGSIIADIEKSLEEGSRS